MAGWAKQQQMGAAGRHAFRAQIVSYELPVGLAIVTGILISGTLSMQGNDLRSDQCKSRRRRHELGMVLAVESFPPGDVHPRAGILPRRARRMQPHTFDIPEAESELVQRLPH